MRPDAMPGSAVPRKVEAEKDVCARHHKSKRPFGISQESEEFIGVKKGTVIKHLGQVQEITDDGVVFCSGLKLSNDSNKGVGEFAEVYVRTKDSESEGVDIIITKATFHITSKNGKETPAKSDAEGGADTWECENLPEPKKPLAITHTSEEYLDLEEGSTVPDLGTIERIDSKGVRFCSGLRLPHGLSQAVGDLSEVKIERGETSKKVDITATKSKFDVTAPVEKEEVSDGDVVVVTYIKEKKTVSKGDYLFKKVSLEGEGFFGMKVTKVDAKGIEFKLDMEIFASKHEGNVWRINYGEKKTIGEFILKVTIKPEKRTGPNTAVVEVTAPEAYKEEKRTTKGVLKAKPVEGISVEPLGKLPYYYGDSEHRINQ